MKKLLLLGMCILSLNTIECMFPTDSIEIDDVEDMYHSNGDLEASSCTDKCGKIAIASTLCCAGVLASQTLPPYSPTREVTNSECMRACFAIESCLLGSLICCSVVKEIASDCLCADKQAKDTKNNIMKRD